jgi:hypothetical protein
MWELIEDLRDMGESGAVLGRRPFIKRDILLSAEAIYKGQFEFFRDRVIDVIIDYSVRWKGVG